MEHDIFGSNKCYGITQDPIIIIFYKSGSKVMDDFIRNMQINSNLIVGIMEFVHYDQFKEIKFIAEVGSYEATWIDGDILHWSYQN